MDFFPLGICKNVVYDHFEDLQQSIIHAINNIDGRIITLPFKRELKHDRSKKMELLGYLIYVLLWN